MFVNYYRTKTADLTISGIKVMEGDRPVESGDYTFTITGSEGAPMPAVTSVTNVDAGYTFGAITYGQECLNGAATATFTYTITESGSVAGVTNDPTSKTVTVTVTDNGDGTITVTSDATEASTKFTNTYNPDPKDSSVTDQLEIQKVLEGRSLKEGEFTFQMIDADGNVLFTETNDADGKIYFDPITFTKTGTYTYTIVEVKGDLGGVTYDGTVMHVTAVVENDFENATFTVTWSDGDLKTLEFTNTYDPADAKVTVSGTKKLEGKALTEGQFSFELRDADGKTVGTATNGADGSFSFSLTFDKPGTYTYTVVEINDGQENITYDTSVKTITVTVTDDLQGALVASVEGSIEFVNTYTEKEYPPTPPTDDRSNLAAMMVLMMSAICGCAFVVKKKKEEAWEE